MTTTFPSTQLMRPKHLHPNVSTPAEYVRAQTRSLQVKQEQFPNLHWPLPALHTGTPAPVKVSESCWQVVCPCGNTPMYDPKWALACCYTCGAIYVQQPPEDWREIERVLLNRPNQINRHMLVGQTLDELRAENRKHGDPD